jgi:hypothetical protein
MDDGAESLDEALKLLRLDREEGIQTVFATPHYGIENGHAPRKENILSGYHRLAEAATKHVPGIRLELGTEWYCAEEIVERIDRKEAWKEDTTEKQYLRVDHIRRGEVPGIHTIRYDSDADLITITHDAHSRKGFALGAVLAAEYTKDHQGLLTISDMFKF